MKSYLTFLLFLSACNLPMADSRSEEQLEKDYDQRVVQVYHQHLAQSLPTPDETYQRNQWAIEKRNAEWNQYLRESAPREPQYIYSPRGELKGWQQEDDGGRVQQYDLDGTWNGTIYE
jgi:flagellar biosynthesis/type III secretory pathway chaperone